MTRSTSTGYSSRASIKPLPGAYNWLNDEGAPRILVEALKLYGTLETPGNASNPEIIAWANEVGAKTGMLYNDDAVPWCGLFMAVCAKRAGYEPPDISVRASAWSTFGNPSDKPMLGDVLVFTRTGGGHVGLYVGEDAEAYHVLGGNQSDAVTITRIAKSRFSAARRSPFKIGQPKNVRRVMLKPSGGLSQNEA